MGKHFSPALIFDGKAEHKAVKFSFMNYSFIENPILGPSLRGRLSGELGGGQSIRLKAEDLSETGRSFMVLNRRLRAGEGMELVLQE